MKVACPSCAAKYSIADEKVQDRLAKIRCRKCGTTIVIDGKANPPTVQSAEGGAASDVDMGHGGSSDEYAVDVGENDQRNMTVQQIVDAYNTGVITADTYVWKDGMPDWVALADVVEINEALHAAAASVQVPAPVYAPAEPAPSPSPLFGGARTPARAATSSAFGSAGADLFGGIDSAGGESDITTSAPDGGGGGITAATGARNESSVLFSLSALTAAQETKTSSKISNEDSGLIDLAALTSAASTGGMAPPMGIDLGSAPLAPSPLGAAPLTGGTAASLGLDAMPPPASNKNGLLIGGGFIVAVLLAGLFAFLLKDDAQPVAAAPTATVVVTAVVPPTTPPEEELAKTTDEAEAEGEKEAAQETKTASTGTKKYYPKKKSSSSSGSGSSSSGSGSSSGSKEPKSSDDDGKKKKKKKKCDCAPSDLMCAMKCSAK